MVAHADAEVDRQDQRMAVQMRAFQENMKSAAMAPMWKRIIKTMVIVLRVPPCAARPRRRSVIVLGQGCRGPGAIYVAIVDWSSS